MLGITHLAQIPLRKEPKHTSEMVSQILFSEVYSYSEMGEEWTKIITESNHYEGWIPTQSIHSLTQEMRHYLSTMRNVMVTEDLVEIREKNNHSPLLVFKGSSFYFTPEGDITIGITRFTISSTVSYSALNHNHSIHEKRTALCSFAKSYINTPYLWGGRTPAGIDCSALVQSCYQFIDFMLPRDAYQQENEGVKISLEAAQPGDVAFFANKNGKVTHTGILLSNKTIIHASGWVKIDTIDTVGIQTEAGVYSHFLHSIKSYL